MIGLEPVLAALIAAAVQTPQTRIESVPLGRIDIPDEIAPAVVPYFDCLMASRGVRSGPPGPGQVAPPPQQLGADCSEVRETSRRQAENRLRDQRRGNPAERRAYVERVLANIDRFAGSVPATPPHDPAKPAEAQAGAAPAELVRRRRVASLDIPDELVPALMPYMRCLDTSSGRVVRNERGIVPPLPGVAPGSDCRDYRLRAQTEGERLLERRGVSSADERRTRVATALDDIDAFLQSTTNPGGTPPPDQASSDASDR